MWDVKRLLCSAVALVGVATPARAYIDAAPALGKLAGDATNIVVLRVEKVSREKRVIVYKNVADLKGRHPTEQVKHRITDGWHPGEAICQRRSIMPGQ